MREPQKRKAQGCFRAGFPRPWRFKGGKKEAGKRYRENHREEINAKKREQYRLNIEKIKVQQKTYRNKNIDKILSYNSKWQKKFWSDMRKEMVNAYGGRCVCCGEAEPFFLDLDHIYNDGAKCRREAKNGRQEMLNLRNLGWPKDRHQLLCCNCNHGKVRNKGICPHQMKNR